MAARVFVYNTLDGRISAIVCARVHGQPASQRAGCTTVFSAERYKSRRVYFSSTTTTVNRNQLQNVFVMRIHVHSTGIRCTFRGHVNPKYGFCRT